MELNFKARLQVIDLYNKLLKSGDISIEEFVEFCPTAEMDEFLQNKN